MDGEYLTGDDEFELQAKEMSTYKLKFSPLKVGTNYGSMTIYNK